LSARDASAEGRGVSFGLEYRVADAGCPTETEFREFVTARLGYDPFVMGAERALTLTTEVVAKNEIVVGITLPRSGNGTTPSKYLRGSIRECAELLQRAALTVALVVEEDAPSTHPEAVAPVKVVPVESRRPDAPPPPQADPRLGIGVAAAVHAGGPAPLPGLFVEVYGSYLWRRASVGLVGRALLPTSETFPLGRVSTTTIAGGPLVCVGGRIIDVCAPLVVGAVLGSGSDVAGARNDVSPFVSVGIRPRWHFVPFGAFDLTVFAEGYLATATTRFAFRAGTAWSTAPIGGVLGVAGSLGVGAR
jgi:hypothetical protein